jgi:hypothetical protein
MKGQLTPCATSSGTVQAQVRNVREVHEACSAAA